MGIHLADYEQRTAEAVAVFWESRDKARRLNFGTDVGERSAVTSGKNMDGFAALAKAVVVANGLPESSVFSGADLRKTQRHATLPGFYRPLKDWDLVVVHRRKLVAALEFKSQTGPSFGNNFNNRCEEALGMGEDFRVAFREGLLGPPPQPFTGYLMLLEDTDASRRPVRLTSRHFPVDPAFEGTSYAQRYELLCRRLMSEGMYKAAALLLSSPESGLSGAYVEPSPTTGMKNLVATLASHVAAAAAL